MPLRYFASSSIHEAGGLAVDVLEIVADFPLAGSPEMRMQIEASLRNTALLLESMIVAAL